jgi:hypothetical protein
MAQGSLASVSLAHCVDFLRPDNPTTAISASSIVELIRACGPELVRLDLTGIQKIITGDVLRAIAQLCPKMESLSGSLGGECALLALSEFGKNSNINILSIDLSKTGDERDCLMDALRYPNFPNLKKLSLTASTKNPVSDELLEAILTNRTGLEHIELRNCADISHDLFQSWIKGYSPDRETTLLVEAMLDQELQRGYLSTTSRQTVVRYSDSEAAGTVVFQGRRLRSKKNPNMSSCSETETTMALELLRNSLVLSDAARALDSLRSLTLVGATKLTDSSLDRLSLMTTYLQSLSVIDAPFVTEESVEPIRRRCRLLRSLEVTGPKLSVRIDSSRFSNRRHRRKAQLPPQTLLKRKSRDHDE